MTFTRALKKRTVRPGTWALKIVLPDGTEGVKLLAGPERHAVWKDALTLLGKASTPARKLLGSKIEKATMISLWKGAKCVKMAVSEAGASRMTAEKLAGAEKVVGGFVWEIEPAKPALAVAG